MDRPIAAHSKFRFYMLALIPLAFIGCGHQAQLHTASIHQPIVLPGPATVANGFATGFAAQQASPSRASGFKFYSVTVASGLWEQPSARPDGVAIEPTTAVLDMLEAEGAAKIGPVSTAEERPAKDLWHRVRHGFGLPDRHHPQARREALSYAVYQDHLDTVIERAEPYLHYILEQIEERGMPTEIALLPIIESAYQPQARSHKGAAGIWQFMAATARHFGLKQSWWYDGRRDIVASTRAALDYLDVLNDHFDGDWLLTLAAYNCGEGTVLRAIKRNREAGKATDFWSLSLPKETKNYIPRLLGISAVIATPENFGIDLEFIPDAPYLASVELDTPIKLDMAAEIADIPYEEIKHLNPGLLHGAIAAKGSYELLLPVDRVAVFTQKLSFMNLDELAPGSIHPHLCEEPKPGTLEVASGSVNEQAIRPAVYTVREGDTLSQIAQRFDLSMGQLCQWNSKQLTGKYLITGHALRLNGKRLTQVD